MQYLRQSCEILRGIEFSAHVIECDLANSDRNVRASEGRNDARLIGVHLVQHVQH